MEITFGDQIKINGEEVPEYLLKALYEYLKLKYPSPFVGRLCPDSIIGGEIVARSITVGKANASQIRTR